MQKILYYTLYYIWYAVACLPMCVHYFNSSIISMLLFHVVRYRRKVVHENIAASYPDKSEKERYTIEREFYRHFCDILVESVMFIGMSDKQMKRHMKINNPEMLINAAKQGHSIALYLGHYANWEWVSSMPLWTGDAFLSSQLYHPLENPVFDKIISRTRERFGGKNIPVNESLRHILKYRKEKPVGVGFIADQVPFWNNIHYWTEFLNHKDTPVFTGPERLAKKLDMATFFLHIKKVKRGYYEAEFQLMAESPKNMPDYELTEMYTRMLEANINEAPAYWLWSHKRWKRTKAEWEQIIDQETGKMNC